MYMSDALTYLGLRLEDPNNSEWTATELRMYIMESARDIVRRAKCYEAEATIAVTAGTRAYTAPSDMLLDGIKSAVFVITGESRRYTVDYIEFHSLNKMALGNEAIHTYSYPTHFTIWGTSLVIYPVTSNNGNLYVQYYRLPANPWAPSYAASNDASTSIEVPTGWDDCVLDGAEYRALRRAQNSRWQEAKAIYEASLNDLISSAQTHFQGPQFIMPYANPLPYWQSGWCQ